MTALRQALVDYLSLRRSLGYQLRRPEKLLHQFLDFLDAAGAQTITTELALAWACQPKNGGENWWGYRLSAVRVFAAYVHAEDASAEVPPRELLPCRPHRAVPYLYSERDIAALVDAADRLRTTLRRATYQTLIGLLAVTGMRVGEAIGLDRSDFDPANGLLLIRRAKFGKTREVPLHPSTVAALHRYLACADHECAARTTAALFISTAGARLLYCNVHWTFKRLVRQAGLEARTGRCRPRIHDLRHAFAVSSLLDACRNGAETQCLTLLPTYLGHVDPAASYWYLSAAPELLALAAERLEHRRGAKP
ncbi:MAG: tyrosine-type recombinase/integrase [Burkholderiaceae bacterium]|nr:tyrosine-type recombinase/integrase [Ideonella sp.]MCC7287814.1 tyrosine-type recombinase/integrase [Burkholderiaceae bacterium]